MNDLLKIKSYLKIYESIYSNKRSCKQNEFRNTFTRSS